MDSVKHLARVEIYALIDPNTKQIRYIGKANDSKKRLASHLRETRRLHYPIYRWIRKLSRNGLIPELKVLLVTDEVNWRTKEIELIQLYKSLGCKLLNVAKGGDEPHCSKEVRASNGRKVARRIHDNVKSKKLWYLKKQLSSDMKMMKDKGNIDSYNRMVSKLINANRPDVFGSILAKHQLI